MEDSGPSQKSLRDRLAQQEKTLSYCIGPALDLSFLDSISLEKLYTASVHPEYMKHPEIEFVYQKFGDEYHPTVKRIVDAWIEDGGNIERAAQTVKRTPSPAGKFPKAYCGFRFQRFSNPEIPVHGLGSKNHEPSTVVIIALEALNHSNGCFVELKPTEFVCVDGNTDVLFPGTGGGIGIFLDLNL